MKNLVILISFSLLMINSRWRTFVMYAKNRGQNAREFKPGMYLYSLVCDGKIVDTKQMILTE